MTIDSETLTALGALVPSLMQRDADSLVIKDATTGGWLAAEGPMTAWVGKPNQSLLGMTDAQLFEAELARELRAADTAALAHSGPLVSEHRVELGSGKQDFSVLRQRLQAPDGRVLLTAVWRDLTTQKKRDAQLRAALTQLEELQSENERLRRSLAADALRDTSSGLYSRAHFDDQLRREVDLSTREHREFALVSIAVDPLPAQAQALGPEVRARVLEALGRLLRNNTRAMDASCRYEGENFAVLLSGVGLATAHSRMEGLRRQCATQIVVFEGHDVGFTVSMGVASFPHTAHSQDELRAASESALAEAGSRGGNRVTLASIRFESSSIAD